MIARTSDSNGTSSSLGLDDEAELSEGAPPTREEVSPPNNEVSPSFMALAEIKLRADLNEARGRASCDGALC